MAVAQDLLVERPFSVPEEELEPIMAWPLEHVMARATKENGWTPEAAAVREREYRRYMTLASRHPGVCLPPPRQIDAVWHAHLMFTANYAAFCRAGAGRFIHHSPSTSEDDVRRYRALSVNTLRCYRELYGEPPADIWLMSPIADCTDCGDGCGDDCG